MGLAIAGIDHIHRIDPAQVIDPRVEGVTVPDHLRGHMPLGLNLSRNFHLETFEIDDAGVRASLSFKGVRSLCVLPWTSILSMTADEKTFFFDEAGRTDLGELAPEPPPPEPPPAPRPRPQLRLVK